MTLCALQLYFEVILAALATLTVAVASIGAAFVARELTTWRKWRK